MLSMPGTFTGLVYLGVMVVVLGLEVWAFVDAARRPADAFKLAGRLEKTPWLIILGLAAGLTFVFPVALVLIAGSVASLVYLYGIRPQIQSFRGGGGRRSSSDGPYGPW